MYITNVFPRVEGLEQAFAVANESSYGVDWLPWIIIRASRD